MNQPLARFAATGAPHLRSLYLTFDDGGLFDLTPVDIYEMVACVRTYYMGLTWLQLDFVFDDNKVRIIIDRRA